MMMIFNIHKSIWLLIFFCFFLFEREEIKMNDIFVHENIEKKLLFLPSIFQSLCAVYFLFVINVIQLTPYFQFKVIINYVFICVFETMALQFFFIQKIFLWKYNNIFLVFYLPECVLYIFVLQLKNNLLDITMYFDMRFLNYLTFNKYSTMRILYWYNYNNYHFTNIPTCFASIQYWRW